jgi:hypothetical protein
LYFLNEPIRRGRHLVDANEPIQKEAWNESDVYVGTDHHGGRDANSQ